MRKKRSYLQTDLISPYLQTRFNSPFLQIRKRREISYTEESARAFCQEYVFNSTAAERCGEVPNIDFGSPIEACVLDLMATGDPNWAVAALDTVKQQCLAELDKNTTLWIAPDPESNITVPPPEILGTICYNECSGRGSCQNGTCNCGSGFVGPDCSIDLSVPPDVYFTPKCDLRARPCQMNPVIGNNFVENDNLTCHLEEIKLTQEGYFRTGTEIAVQATFESYGEVLCPTAHSRQRRDINTEADGFLISISNNGELRSRSVLYIIYDSVCQACNVSIGVCTMNENSCNISGICYGPGDANPTDSCLVCNPAEHQYNWFPSNATECLPSTISTPITSTPADINECENPATVCPAHSTCSNTVGSYECLCDPGFASTTGQAPCTDINECDDPAIVCPVYSTCSNTPGSYECRCNPGFTRHNATGSCIDIDECIVGTLYCHVDADCSNYPGGFTCTCKDGYMGNGTHCQDIDECTVGTFDCHADAVCINTQGSFSCTCKEGYVGNGTYCEDIDECAVVETNNCHVDANCINTQGSFSCLCKDGYLGNGTYCEDIDECTVGAFNCHVDAHCINTQGSFSCTCKEGYVGNGTYCEDVDECAVVETNNCHVDANCINTQGAFSCTCKDGYVGNGTYCADFNECVDTATVCPEHSTCSNTVGSYECLCDPGFTSSTGQAPCIDVDECEGSTCPDLSTCLNTPGSYKCLCNAGFTSINGEAPCTDINECEDSAIICHAHATCSNTFGSFVCLCDPGYVLHDGNCVPQTVDDWCRYCIIQRNGPNLYEDPLDCSKYYQCSGDGENVQAYHQSCAPCTYWDQDKLTCVSLADANCTATAPPRTFQSDLNSCSRYYKCYSHGYTLKCCEPGFGFDYAQQECVENGCTDDCSVTSSTATSSSTTTVLPTSDVCYFLGWYRETIPGEPSHYWLLWNGQRYQKLSCAPNIFDITICDCQQAPYQGCLVVHLPLDDNFNDVFNNYVDPGTTELVSFPNGEGAAKFNHQSKSTIEIPFFNNYDWRDKTSISFWYKNEESSPVARGVLTNGDCDNKGTINVWVEGSVVKGGFVTSSLSLEEAFISHALTNPLNEWHHVVLTYDGSVVSFYIDNVSVGTKNTSGYILRTPAPMTIGFAFCDGEKFEGFVDDLRVFKCALPATAVSELFNNHVLPA